MSPRKLALNRGGPFHETKVVIGTFLSLEVDGVVPFAVAKSLTKLFKAVFFAEIEILLSEYER
jgi:hypothetical protein